MKKSGFTLIEALVVIGVLSVIGMIILNVFSRSLRGSNKSQILGSIKQNGQLVLENMDKTIRNSDNVVCPAEKFPDPKTLVVRSAGIYTRYRFTDDLIQKDNPFKQTDQSTGKEETDPAFINRVCLFNDPMPGSTILTDTNPKTGVTVISGQFLRSRSAGFSDQLTVKFSLKHGAGAPEAIAGQIDPVHFETTIQLR